MPARVTSYTASSGRWGGGEFVYPVKVNYAYGRDPDIDVQQFGVVFEAVRKMVGGDVVRTADFGGIAVSGMDRVNLSERAQSWETEVQESLENISGWQLF